MSNRFTDSIVGLVNSTFTKTAELEKKADFNVSVRVGDYEAKAVAKELNMRDIKEASRMFAQDIINRYFNVEYLDVEKLRDRISDKELTKTAEKK